MNDDTFHVLGADHNDKPRAQRAADVLLSVGVAPLSTAGGCCAIVASLWSVLSHGWLSAWLVAGLLIAFAQWQAQHAIQRRRRGGPAGVDARRRRRLIVSSALVSGVFWGLSSLALFPVVSNPHQMLLACVLVIVAALWIPLFALTRLALPAFAVPGLLPMAFALLTSTQPPQTTMGSLLFLMIAVLAVATNTTRRMFLADVAVRRELYRQATHDCLVGLANRAEFHRRAQTLEIMGDSRYAILYIDIDHFKEVNDTAGHAAGDELLRRIGAVLKDVVRKDDVAARLGGDEFAILMRDCSAADAAQVAANVLERIRAFSLNCGDRCRRISASIGIACSADLFVTPAKLLDAADQACYAAKRGGRNRIEIATGLNDASRTAARPSLVLAGDATV
jgi:diguanylate cyclase (GGDEF)-like protein